jgi:lipoate---protein ligase
LGLGVVKCRTDGMTSAEAEVEQRGRGSDDGRAPAARAHVAVSLSAVIAPPALPPGINFFCTYAPSMASPMLGHASRRVSARVRGALRSECRWRPLSSFTKSATDTTTPVKTYISRSDDPYLNLSIEHHLLQETPSDSVVLFLYTNRPCIVIGRNQNPWMEVNLGLLDATSRTPANLGKVDLVRRRSGGGTVFHDEGNINWSVICPSSIFTRDKHAEVVVSALRKLGVERSRVNQRHDIVLDQGPRSQREVAPHDTHRTPFETDASNGPPALKVSGSAYKLTRARSLHHGTCLLSSPNLPIIPSYLHSPAKPFMNARGVESVSSPVGNVGIDHADFIDAVSEEFSLRYGKSEAIEVGEEQAEEEKVRKGLAEITTMDWIMGQTPQFTFSTHPDWEGANTAIMASTTLPPSVCQPELPGVVD